MNFLSRILNPCHPLTLNCHIFGSIASAFGLGGNDAGSQAAGAANPFYDRAISELKRQFNKTQESLAPFINAGTEAIPGVVQGTTAGGLDERLREIFNTDIFGSLVDERERSVRGQLGAGGLTRSGTAVEEIAKVPQSIGLALEELLSGRLGGLMSAGQNAATGVGSLGANKSANIANMLMGQGQNVSSGIITDAQSAAQGGQNLLNTAGTIASIFFSDPSLKTNVEKVSEIHDLNLYQWDWIPEAKDTMIEECPTIGFMADEVAEKYPECVSEYGGFMIVDYPKLLDTLGA